MNTPSYIEAERNRAIREKEKGETKFKKKVELVFLKEFFCPKCREQKSDLDLVHTGGGWDYCQKCGTLILKEKHDKRETKKEEQNHATNEAKEEIHAGV